MNKLKTLLYLPIIAIYVLFTFIGCNKHLFDYRNKFLGDYTFNIHETGYNTLSNEIVDTMYIYNGKIEYGKNEKNISISFLEALSAEPNLYEDGSIIGDGVRGEFNSTNKLGFTFSGGGRGNGIAFNITGEKTK